ncbi:MAG: hypothetical protein LBD11_04370 [Candidatus Peribacteria bacterium]|jgi:uncharacterized cysteine cluster protein YcgN (CxxCxxCC family)|nr:hypothetical protein [Candidatus Peribacteria bacterium]
MRKEKWETLCKRCGKCCHIKHRVGKITVIDPKLVCPHLQDDNTCDIYDHRLGPECLSVQEVLRKGISGIIPETCGYAQLNPAYRFARDPSDIEEFWTLVAENGSVCEIKIARYFYELSAKKREIAKEE